MMLLSLKKFWQDDSGAVTVDWVVLTAIILGIGMLVLNPIAFQAQSATQGVATDVRNTPVGFGNY